jgi:hypothetical protein
MGGQGEWEMEVTKQDLKWTSLCSTFIIHFCGVNDLAASWPLLEKEAQMKGVGPILGVSTFSSENVLYLKSVPFSVCLKFTYISIGIIKYLNWSYKIFICFLEIPKMKFSKSGIRIFFFFVCGNCVRVL